MPRNLTPLPSLALAPPRPSLAWPRPALVLSRRVGIQLQHFDVVLVKTGESEIYEHKLESVCSLHDFPEDPLLNLEITRFL